MTSSEHTGRVDEIRARLDNLACNTPPWTAEHDPLGTDINFGDHYQVIDADGDLVAAVENEPIAELLVHAAADMEHLLKRAKLLEQAYEHAKEQRAKYERRVIQWREQCSLATRERDAALVNAKQLQGRLDTAEGRLAHFAAQHQPHDNLFKTCRSCKDGYGDPLPWPCADAVALGLGEGATDER